MTIKDCILTGLDASVRKEFEGKEVICPSYLNTEEMSKAITLVANLLAETQRKITGSQNWDGVNASKNTRNAFYRQIADVIMK